jgi:WD40 repeat protein
MKYISSSLIFCLLTLSLFAQDPTKPKAFLTGHSNDVDVVARSSQGIIATGSSDFKINLYKIDSPYALIKTFGGHLGPITALAFSKNGKMMASGGEDRLIQLWDSTMRTAARLEMHKDRVNFLIFDNTGRYLYSGSDDKTMLIWDTKTGKVIKTITNTQPISAIAPTSDIKLIYLAGTEPKIKLMNVMTGQVAKTLDGHTDAVNDIAITPDGKTMISGSNDKTARVWNLVTGKQLRILPVDCWKVLTVSISDDGKYATTGCNDGSIKIWDLETGKLLNSIYMPGAIARNVIFGKNVQEVLAAFMLSEGTDYGLRIYDSKINNTPIHVAIKPTTFPADSLPAGVKPAVKPSKIVPIKAK